MTVHDRPVVGTTFSHYVLLEEIGEGGMGVVFKAQDQRLGRPVALKFLSPRSVGIERFEERFTREARAAAALDHPHICPVYEIETVDDQMFIAMAWVDGESLAHMISREALSLHDALDIAIQIGDGLQAAHDKGIVHRDVKPENIIVDTSGRVRILDFGVAMLRDTTRITEDGLAVGTLSHMSPEQALGNQCDQRVDIWGLGVVLYESLTSSLPFVGGNQQAVIYAIISRQPPPVTAKRASLPLAIEPIINKALAKEPDRRYQRIGDMVADLRQVRHSDPDGQRPADRAPPAPLSYPHSTDGADRTRNAAHQLKILVVDDEPDLELLVRQRFRKQIRQGEMEFVFATNGVQALERVAADPMVDIVLTDIRMPEMDGLTLLTKLGALDRILRTVVVSAYGDMPNFRSAMNRGAFDFLTKPIDFQDLETTIKKTHEDLERLRKARNAADQLATLQQELHLAQRIQEGVLPRSQPKPSGVEVCGYMIPAREVGGDFYDYFELANDRLGIVIGDVSGRGVAAAMVAAVTRSVIKAVAMRGMSPSQCLEAANRLLYAEGLRAISVTAVYGVLNLTSGEFVYCNAGQIPPYRLSAAGGLERASAPSDAALCVAESTAFNPVTLELRPGDSLIIHTDGIPDALDPARTRFGEDGLDTTLRGVADEPASEIVRRVFRAVDDFVSGAQPTDDQTVLVVNWGGGSC